VVSYSWNFIWVRQISNKNFKNVEYVKYVKRVVTR
jgi:hypothetical protein